MAKIILVFIGIILLPNISQAETRYIGDTLIVAMRNGPGNSFSIVKTLRTGNKITVLGQQGDYLQVEADDKSQGWIQTQYTITEPPRGLIVPKLRERLNQLILSNKHFSKEVAALKEELAQKDQEFAEKHQEIINQDSESKSILKSTQQELAIKTSQYDDLLKQSKDFLNIKQERDTLKKSHASLQARVENLEIENNSLANKQMFYWFLAGAGVLLIGWIIGKTSAKKQRSTLSL